jgi:hypothetical protein
MYAGKRRRSVSPRGNNTFEEVSTYKERIKDAKSRGFNSKDKDYRQIASGGYSSRRDACGYSNPSHDHPNMIPLFRDGAMSPIPHSPGSRGEREHLMKPERHFQTETGPVQGHSNTVLGHNHGSSAGQTWNRDGHKRPRRENLEKNRDRSAYHGLEERKASAKSGSKEERYLDPSPSKGSHPMYWNQDDPNFKGGFGSYYRQV